MRFERGRVRRGAAFRWYRSWPRSTTGYKPASLRDAKVRRASAKPCLEGERRAKDSPLVLGEMAEEVGFEPTVELPLRLISSQVPSTAQPLFRNRVV